MAKKPTNDDKVLQLKQLVQEKREKIDKSKKFTPITNCSIELDGIRYNLHTQNKATLGFMLVKLNMYVMSAKDLSFPVDDIHISGFSVVDWIKDIAAKIDNLSIVEQENNLKQLEKKLSDLLSADKRVELELGAIEDMLK